MYHSTLHLLPYNIYINNILRNQFLKFKAITTTVPFYKKLYFFPGKIPTSFLGFKIVIIHYGMKAGTSMEVEILQEASNGYQSDYSLLRSLEN